MYPYHCNLSLWGWLAWKHSYEASAGLLSADEAMPVLQPCLPWLKRAKMPIAAPIRESLRLGTASFDC